MTMQDQYDDGMFDFSRGEYASAIAKFQAVLMVEPAHFDAQLALGMAYYRQGDYAQAIVEGHKAEQIRPKEQLTHTNLSLFYQKAGDKAKAEHHGLQARIAGWREENQAARTGAVTPETPGDPELQMAKPVVATKVIRMPDKFPDQPWKKK
jgi:tetratricopeptide (TPR) repeat protein